MVTAVVVDIIQHGGQGRRFTGTGFTSDENDALVHLGQVHGRRRQAEVLELGDLLTQQTQSQRGRALGTEQMDTAAVAAPGAGGVNLADRSHLFIFAAGEELSHVLAILLGQRGIGHVLELAVLAVFGREAADQVKVGSAVCFAFGDESINIYHS